jgi:hypothetical protein
MNQDLELKKTLQRWNPQVTLPQDFQSEVWRRIAAREEEASSAFFRSLWADLADLFPRFAVGVPCLALVLALAVLSGQIQSQHETEADRARWQNRYLDSIDPYAKARHHLAP